MQEAEPATRKLKVNNLKNGTSDSRKDWFAVAEKMKALLTEYELKNRYTHVDYGDDNFQNVISKVPKSQFDTLECTLEELAVLKLIYKNPSIKQKDNTKCENSPCKAISYQIAVGR